MTSGIYIICNHMSNKFYIGQTRNLERRKSDHIRALRKGTHHNKYLQRAFNHDGEDSFEFKVLKKCPVDELDKWERHFISRFRSMDNRNGYNLESGGNVGKEVSEAVRDAKRGEKNPMYGKHLKAAHVEALRVKNRCHGSSLAESDVEKIKVALLNGAKCRDVANQFNTTPQVITKIKTGKNFYWVRPDLNDKISERNLKRDRDETIRALSEQGYSRQRISKEVGVTPATVARVLGFSSGYYVKNSAEKQMLRENVLNAYKRKVPREEIMQTYGIRPSMYVAIISDEYNKEIQTTKDRAVELRKSGMMVKDIAEELGYARTTISKWTKTVK